MSARPITAAEGKYYNGVTGIADMYAGWGHPAGEPPDDTPTNGLHPVLVNLADVEAKPIEWLWPGRIPSAKLTLLSGDPGQGKSFLTLDIAARITNGTRWPECDSHAPRGRVVLLSAEDDLADTIKPRLAAAGADASMVMALQSVVGRDDDGEYERLIDLQRDAAVISQILDTYHDVRLIVVDPVSAYLGKADSYRDTEVRAVLAPLAKLAAERSVAILAVMHLRKGDGPAMYRTMGSLGFVAAARAVWALTKDKQDPKRRLLLPVKCNLAPDLTGLAFTLSLRHSEAAWPCVVWEAEPITTTADDALDHNRNRPPIACDEAADFLKDALGNGPRLSKEIDEEAREAHGIAKRTLDRAKKNLNVIAYRETVPGPWWLKLPESNTASDFPV